MDRRSTILWADFMYSKQLCRVYQFLMGQLACEIESQKKKYFDFDEKKFSCLFYNMF